MSSIASPGDMPTTSSGPTSPPIASVADAVADLLGDFAKTRDGRRFVAASKALQDASSHDERIDALHDLISWSRRKGRLPEALKQREIPEAFQRFALFIKAYETIPQARASLLAAVQEILRHSNMTSLVASAGLPSGRGFLAEATDRFIAKLVPAPRDDHDLGRIFVRMFRHPAEVDRLGQLPLGLFARLVDLISPSSAPELMTALRADFADGLRLLATRVRASGLHDPLRERSTPCRVDQSPFFQISVCADALASRWTAGEDGKEAAEACRKLIARCRDEVLEISRRIESSGVSVDIVYGVDLIERCLSRMGQMIGIAGAHDPDTLVMRLHDFFSRLITASYKDRNITELLRDTTGLLGRKIVERNGRSGEHYVARTAAEYRHIWVAAAGGGIVAGCMGAMKFPVLEAHHAPFVEGLLLTGIYIGGFLLMQAFALILATKQPAMFGATIADIVRTHDRAGSVDALATLATQILRSQLAATISNLILVSLTAFAVSGIWWSLYGHPYLSTEEAIHTYKILDPLASGTIAYAALTGLLLWLASMAGGLLDNWSVYHRIPQGIADHPLGRVVGWNRMARLAGMWSRRVADIGTNVTLGILLGMTPILGEFFGIPLDVRHVTLSTGKFMLGVASLGDAWYENGLIWSAAAGVAVMFVLNLGVGFFLALYVALRAYGLPPRRMLTVLKLFVKRVGQKPVVDETTPA